MRVVEVYCSGVLAGTLSEENRRSFVFRYDSTYYHDTDKAAVSLTLPKTQLEHHSEYLFPFFFNMLSEGANKQLQCKMLKIDEKDYFGLLMATAQYDTVGAVTVKPLKIK